MVATKDKSIIICGIVRDAGKGLRKNIPVVKSLCRCFASYKIVVFENDSKDDTKDLLRAWADEDRENVHVSMCDRYQISTIPNNSPKAGINRFFCHARIDKMASLRNQYLQYVEETGLTADYLAVVDLDVAQLFLEPILGAFACDRQWDAVCAYGYSISPSLRRRYHDTYALTRLEDRDIPQTEEMIFRKNRFLDGISAGHDWIRVASAFGGLTIYRFEALKDVRYQVLENNDPHVEVHCEHFSIYRQMEQNGYDRFFVVPSMVLKYQEIDKSVIKQFLKRIFSIK